MRYASADGLKDGARQRDSEVVKPGEVAYRQRDASAEASKPWSPPPRGSGNTPGDLRRDDEITLARA